MESDDKAFDTPIVSFESLDLTECVSTRVFDLELDFDRCVMGGG